MKRTITAILGITAVIWMAAGQADVTVMAVRLGAKDAGTLAKFYQTVFGLKEIDHVGQPATEVIMRYGATVAAAKAPACKQLAIYGSEAAVPELAKLLADAGIDPIFLIAPTSVESRIEDLLVTRVEIEMARIGMGTIPPHPDPVPSRARRDDAWTSSRDLPLPGG